MTVEEIKAVVDAGNRVHCKTDIFTIAIQA